MEWSVDLNNGNDIRKLPLLEAFALSKPKSTAELNADASHKSLFERILEDFLQAQLSNILENIDHQMKQLR